MKVFQKKDYFAGVVIFFLAFLFFCNYLHIPEGRSFRDEGFLYYGAERILDGQLIYRDFHEIQFPGSFFLLAGVFKIAHSRFETGRLLNYLLVASGIALYLLIVRTAKVRFLLSMLPCMLIIFFWFPQWAGTLPHWFSFFSTALALFFLNLYLIKSSGYLLFLSGISVGFTLNFIQNEGALLFVGVIIFLLLRSFVLKLENKKVFLREALIFTLGFIPVALIFPIYFLFKGAFYDFIYNTFFYLFESYLPANRLPYFSYFADVFAMDLLSKASAVKSTFWLFYIYVVVFIIYLIQFGLILIYIFSLISLILDFKLFQMDRVKSLMLTVTGIFLFLSQLHKPDPIRLMFVSFPALLLGAIFLEGLYERFKFLIIPFVITLYIVTLTAGCVQVYEIFTKYPCFVEAPGGRIYFKNELVCYELDTLQNYIKRVDLREGDIFIHNWATHYYFLFKWKNPTPVDGLIRGHNSDEQFKRTLEILEQIPPLYVLTDDVLNYMLNNPAKSPFPMIPPEVLKDDPVWDFIRKNYNQVLSLPASGLTLWRRRSE